MQRVSQQDTSIRNNLPKKTQEDARDAHHGRLQLFVSPSV